MDSKKIEIQIKDNGIYTYIALIIDRPGVRKDLTELRCKWGGKNLKNKLIGFNLDVNNLFIKHKLPATLYPVFREAITTWSNYPSQTSDADTHPQGYVI